MVTALLESTRVNGLADETLSKLQAEGDRGVLMLDNGLIVFRDPGASLMLMSEAATKLVCGIEKVRMGAYRKWCESCAWAYDGVAPMIRCVRVVEESFNLKMCDGIQHYGEWEWTPSSRVAMAFCLIYQLSEGKRPLSGRYVRCEEIFSGYPVCVGYDAGRSPLNVADFTGHEARPHIGLLAECPVPPGIKL